MADENVDSVIMEVSSHSLAWAGVEGCEYDIGVFTICLKIIWIFTSIWKNTEMPRLNFSPRAN